MQTEWIWVKAVDLSQSKELNLGVPLAVKEHSYRIIESFEEFAGTHVAENWGEKLF